MATGITPLRCSSEPQNVEVKADPLTHSSVCWETPSHLCQPDCSGPFLSCSSGKPMPVFKTSSYKVARQQYPGCCCACVLERCLISTPTLPTRPSSVRGPSDTLLDSGSPCWELHEVDICSPEPQHRAVPGGAVHTACCAVHMVASTTVTLQEVQSHGFRP